MKILVVGGTGFIGSHLVKHFSNMNHEVLSLSRKLLRPKKIKEKNIKYYEGNLKNKKLLFKLTTDIDVIIHCASSFTPRNPDITGEDLENTKNLVEAFINNKVKKFVYFSSGGAIYGSDSLLPFSESCDPSPRSSYGKSKLKIENFLARKFKDDYEKLLILRPSNPYGPILSSKPLTGIISVALKTIYKKNSLDIYGDGSAYKDFIHINDLAKITYNLINSSKFGVYNIGSGEKTTINELMSIISNLINRELDIIYHDAFDDDVSFFLDTEKVFSNQPHKSLIKLDEGIDNLWKTYFN